MFSDDVADPRITVAVCTHNRAGQLEDCLLALLAGLLLLATAESLLLLVYFSLGERAAWSAVAACSYCWGLIDLDSASLP